MKWNDILEHNEKIITESEAQAQRAENYLDSMDDAYEDIILLRDTFRKKDFGILIGKRNKKLDYRDIKQIKIKINDILNNNAIISGVGNRFDTIDGKERMRIFYRQLGHGLELTLTAAIGGALGVVGLTVATGGFGLVAAGIGALIAGISGVKQLNLIRSLSTASRALKIAKQFGKFNKSVTRSVNSKMEARKLGNKSVEDIEYEFNKELKRTKNRTEQEFKRLIGNLPDNVIFKNRDGELETMPTHMLFEAI